MKNKIKLNKGDPEVAVTEDKKIYKQLAKTLDKMANAMISVAKSIDEVHDKIEVINKKLNIGGKNETKRKSLSNIKRA